MVKIKELLAWCRPVVILVCFALWLLAIGVAFSSADIGCEPYGSDMVKAWNEGSIENTTYYSIDGVQMANHLDRFTWATYDWGLRYNNNLFSFYDMPYTFLGCRTDNLTYYELVWSVYYQQGNRRAWLNYTIGQGLNDDYVNLTLTFAPTGNGWNNLHQPVYIYRALKDIDINNNGNTDAFTYYNASGWQGMDLNITADEPVNNINQELSVGEVNQPGAIMWKWDGMADGLLVNDYPDNAEVYWWHEFLDDVQSGTIYTSTEQWIDVDPCVKSCNRGVSYNDNRPKCKATNSTSVCLTKADTLNAEMFDYVVILSLFGGSCSYSPTCVINNSRYINGNFIEIPGNNDTTEKSLVTTSWTFYSAEQGNIQQWSASDVNMHTRYFNVTCWNSSNSTIYSYFTAEHDFGGGTLKIVCPSDNDAPSVNLSLPANNTITTTTLQTFECNASDKYPLNNITLYANFSGTMEANYTYVPFPNTTHTLTHEVNLTPGVYGWYCGACDANNHCQTSTQTWTIIIETPTTPTISKWGLGYVSRDIEELEDWMVYVFGGGILGVGVGVMLVRRRKQSGFEDVGVYSDGKRV